LGGVFGVVFCDDFVVDFVDRANMQPYRMGGVAVVATLP
jgi:hypothetical protein